MDTITTLHHVNLKTTRLTEMIDGYRTVVGRKPQHVAPVGAFLTNVPAGSIAPPFPFLPAARERLNRFRSSEMKS